MTRERLPREKGLIRRERLIRERPGSFGRGGELIRE